MKVAVLGYGTVGKGVYDMLRTCPLLEAGPVLVRSGKVDEPYKVDSMQAICADVSVDAVAETMGGTGAAYEYAVMALKAGKHFVTSNKALVAARGIELAALARENNVGFLFSAACGGAVPYLHNLELARESDEIISLGGILNGTTNYMLDMMQSEGLDYDAALKDAQALGYAEADPTADVSGLDALRKIMLACAVAYDMLPVDGLVNEGIENLRASDVADIKRRGLCCRLLVKGGRNDDGSIYAYVQPALLGSTLLSAQSRRTSTWQNTSARIPVRSCSWVRAPADIPRHPLFCAILSACSSVSAKCSRHRAGAWRQTTAHASAHTT